LKRALFPTFGFPTSRIKGASALGSTPDSLAFIAPMSFKNVVLFIAKGSDITNAVNGLPVFPVGWAFLLARSTF
jgi:hypothetical protein